MNFLSHRPSIPAHPAGAAFHSPGHGAAGLNLNAHMPRELSAATQGLNPSEFRAEAIKIEAPPSAIQLYIGRGWQRQEPRAQPETLGFSEVAKFCHTSHVTAVVRVLVARPRWEVDAAEWTQAWLLPSGYRFLSESKRNSPMGEITETLCVQSRGRSTRVARSAAIRHGNAVLVVQAVAAPDEFEALASELSVTFASVRSTSPLKPQLVEEVKTCVLRRPAGTFQHPASWTAAPKSCLLRPFGDAMLLTHSAADMGPSQIGVEAAPASADVHLLGLMEGIRRGLHRHGLVYGDPRIKGAVAAPPCLECVTFDSRGMLSGMAVEVAMRVLEYPEGLVALWCIVPSSDALAEGGAVTRRTFDIVEGSLRMVTVSKERYAPR